MKRATGQREEVQSTGVQGVDTSSSVLLDGIGAYQQFPGQERNGVMVPVFPDMGALQMLENVDMNAEVHDLVSICLELIQVD
jgi:hypothetical protein